MNHRYHGAWPIANPKVDLRLRCRWTVCFLFEMSGEWATYLVMYVLVDHPRDHPEPRTFSRAQQGPEPRPIRLPHGFEQLSVTSGLVLGLVLFGPYVFRLRL